MRFLSIALTTCVFWALLACTTVSIIVWPRVKGEG